MCEGGSAPNVASPQGQLRRRQLPRKLDQSEWIAVRLGKDAVPNTGIEWSRDRGLQERRRGIDTQAANHEIREIGQPCLLGRVPYCQHDAHWLCVEPAGDELKRIC